MLLIASFGLYDLFLVRNRTAFGDEGDLSEQLTETFPVTRDPANNITTQLTLDVIFYQVYPKRAGLITEIPQR